MYFTACMHYTFALLSTIVGGDMCPVTDVLVRVHVQSQTTGQCLRVFLFDLVTSNDKPPTRDYLNAP